MVPFQHNEWFGRPRCGPYPLRCDVEVLAGELFERGAVAWWQDVVLRVPLPEIVRGVSRNPAQRPGVGDDELDWPCAQELRNVIGAQLAPARRCHRAGTVPDFGERERDDDTLVWTHTGLWANASS